ncbi:MAG: hypothetical protein AB7R90_06705 [Reyranellaceae bacterium]
MRFAALLLALCVVLPARAEEPRGCDKFTLSPAVPPTERLALQPFKDARLALPPERAPKDAASFAGARIVEVPAAGLYQVSLSDYAWIDVVQEGRYVKSGKFSGALECPGLRKIVRFELKLGTAVIQVSGVAAASIALGFMPASP